MKRASKHLIWGIVLIIIIAALIPAYFKFLKPPVNTDNSAVKNIVVSVSYKDGTKKDFEISTTKSNLADALLEKGLVTSEDMADGFINSVDGITAETAKEEWWKITKNGEDLMTGAKDTPINDGDRFELIFSVGFY